MALSVDIRKALGNFHLAVQFDAGDETLALLGASGCGKSVTLKCIAGILTPDEGHIELDGVTLYDSASRINQNIPGPAGLLLVQGLQSVGDAVEQNRIILGEIFAFHIRHLHNMYYIAL